MELRNSLWRPRRHPRTYRSADLGHIVLPARARPGLGTRRSPFDPSSTDFQPPAPLRDVGTIAGWAALPRLKTLPIGLIPVSNDPHRSSGRPSLRYPLKAQTQPAHSPTHPLDCGCGGDCRSSLNASRRRRRRCSRRPDCILRPCGVQACTPHS